MFDEGKKLMKRGRGKSLMNQFNHCHYLMKGLLQLIVMEKRREKSD